jgi:hypothetical protein
MQATEEIDVVVDDCHGVTVGPAVTVTVTRTLRLATKARAHW